MPRYRVEILRSVPQMGHAIVEAENRQEVYQTLDDLIDETPTLKEITHRMTELVGRWGDPETRDAENYRIGDIEELGNE